LPRAAGAGSAAGARSARPRDRHGRVGRVISRGARTRPTGPRVPPARSAALRHTGGAGGPPAPISTRSPSRCGSRPVRRFLGTAAPAGAR
jgi:hypothetical protein